MKMSTPRVLQTPRLTLRPPEEEDVPALFSIQGNPVDMRFTYVPQSLAECSRRIKAYEDSRKNLGFAPWVMVDKTDKQVVGWGGLGVDPDAPEWGPEVSYFLHRAHWNRGLATELVQAATRLAFQNFAISPLGAFAKPDNAASIRVLQKCGFAFQRYVPTLERNFYQCHAACAT